MGSSQQDTNGEEDLRRWVTSRLGEEVPQPIWEEVKDEDYVEDALNPNRPGSRQECLDRVTKYLRLVRETFSEPDLHGRDAGEVERIVGEQEETRVIGLSPSDPLYWRGQAFTAYLIKLVAQDSMVQEFRRRVLGGGKLTADQAVAIMDSPAMATFSCAWFEEQGVPFVGHKAEVLEGEWPPPKGVSRVRGRIKIEWDGGELLTSYKGAAPFRGMDVTLGPKVRGRRKLVVLKHSVLGLLFEFSQRLHERYPWWLARMMPMFVLMEQAPMVGRPGTYFYNNIPSSYPEVLRRSRVYQPIVLEIPPWFPVANVTQIYKIVKELIPTTSQPSLRRLALFEFVVKHPEVTVPREGQINVGPSWAALLRAWNEGLPAGHEWRYDDRRNLWRDFQKAFDQIVNYYR